jgi:thiosulfate/3-mercaptopyruvate sulfurtransferase
VLDARGWWAYRGGHVPGAVRISWLDHRAGRGRTGKLPRDLDALARALAQKGVDGGTRVVVYGAAGDGWGEEGRIAWMLYYLGHPDVTVLDGGWAAWRAAGGPIERAAPPALPPGHFSAHPRAAVRATADDVAAATTTGALVLDTRSAAEWRGSRRYWPARVGHVPGAVHLEWRDLLDAAGRLDRSPAQRLRLAARGLTPDRPVIAYCVGGVRSGEAFWALRALGFRDVRNYDGSWYEWSADPRRPVAH